MVISWARQYSMRLYDTTTGLLMTQVIDNMKKQNPWRVLAIGLFCILVGASQPVAESINPRAGTSAFSFLKINIGARPVAMGSAFTGVADDESSFYYNPAGLATLEDDRYLMGFHDYLAGMQSGVLAYIHPLDYTHVVSVYVSYLNYGEMVRTDQTGQELGTFGGGDLLLGFSYARNQTRHLQLGVTAKIIYEKIDEYSASGFAMDLGVKYSGDRKRYTLGAAIKNIGMQTSNFTDTGKDKLPMMFRVGASVRPRILDLVLAGDVIIPTDNDVDLAIGAEYYHLDPLFIRAGWNSFGSNFTVAEAKDSWAGMSMGFGISFKRLGPLRHAQLSYSYTPAADLGNSHRITFTGGK